MNPRKRTVEWVVWASLALTMLGVGAVFIFSQILQRSGGARDLPVITQGLPDFTLTDQNGRTVTPADLKGQVWIGDIIFTRCPGPCASMTQRMSSLQSALPAKLPVRLVTLTTDPENDTPSVLKRYAETYGADADRWMFLTGSKSDIARLAVDGLKLAAIEKQPEQRESEQDLFIHSTSFVIVDKQGRLRGAFESTEPDFKDRIVRAAKKLARE